MIYTTRWVPSRSLIYRRIYKESPEIKECLTRSNSSKEDQDSTTLTIMLGAGAGSEVIALTSLLERILEWKDKIEILAIDSSDWSNVLQKQEQALFQHYSETLSPSKLSINFKQSDVLSDFNSIPYSKARLITILFTISELLLQARTTTLTLLAHLTTETQPGTLLLIVESASLALIPIGSSGRTYPLGTLLDHALAPPTIRKVGGDGEKVEGKWKILRSQDSEWFRMPIGAKDCYPLQLENSRCLVRLYQRI